MFELLAIQEESFTSTVVPGVADDNESHPHAGNYTENDPRRCYVLGEADACVRSVFNKSVLAVCIYIPIDSIAHFVII